MKAKSIFIILLFLSSFEVFAESTELWRLPTYYADVRMAEVSNSGNYFAGFHQKFPSLQIFNLRTGEIIQTKYVDFEVLDMKFNSSEDKLELYSYGDDEFVLNTIDLSTGLLTEEYLLSDLKPSKIRFKDGKIFALFPNGSLKIWDNDNKDEYDFPALQKYNISNFNIADSIALVHSNDSIFVFNYKTGYEYVSFRYLFQGNLDYAVNLDLNKVYIANIYDGITVERFNLSTGVYEGGWENGSLEAWFFDNETVISQGSNKIYFYNISTGELEDEIEIGSKYYVVNDDLNILLSVGGRKIEYWNLETKTKEYEWYERVFQDFEFSIDSKQIIFFQRNKESSRIYDVTSGQLQFESRYSDGKYGYLRNYNEYIDYFRDSLTADSVLLIDLNTDIINESFVLPAKYLMCIIPQTKEYIFFLSDYDSIHVHDYGSKDKLFSLKIDLGFTHLSYTGRYLIGRESYDTHFMIYDCKRREIIYEDKSSEIQNYSLPDYEGKLYYSILNDGIYFLDLVTLETKKIFSVDVKDSFSFGLDNHTYFTEKDFFVEGFIKNVINFRKYNTEEIILTIDEYPVEINSLSLSDDHTKLAVSYLDGTFIMYDLGDALSVPKIGNSPVVSAFPNPFSETTTISYNLLQANRVTITIFDALGNEIAVPVNEYVPAGEHKTQFNGTHLQSGIYYYSIRIGSGTRTGKMILVK